jgi:hypothetical protein
VNQNVLHPGNRHAMREKQDVDGRVKPGHDDVGSLSVNARTAKQSSSPAANRGFRLGASRATFE